MITNVLIGLAFVLALIFPLSYARSKWSMYPPGRALMLFSVIVAIVLGLATWRAFTGDFVAQWIRAATYAGIVFGLAYLDYVLLAEQRKDRKEVQAMLAENRARQDGRETANGR